MTCFPDRGRNRGEIRNLILPLVLPPYVETPYLRCSRLVSKRLERDACFNGPTLFEPGSRQLPVRLPAAVDSPLVRHLRIHPAPERGELEEHAVAPVVERVEHEGKVFVPWDARGVPSHLVDDHPLRVAVPIAAH